MCESVRTLVCVSVGVLLRGLVGVDCNVDVFTCVCPCHLNKDFMVV